MKSIKYLLFLPILFTFCNNSTVNSTKNIESENPPFAVVQLFTSQGCSSCPSADALLEKVKKKYSEKNIIVLSYHVDYWDRLGWKDPFSKKEFSNLQYQYAENMGKSGVYTPQAVINGNTEFVGSNESKMENALSSFLKVGAENNVKFTEIKKSGNTISFKYDVEGGLSGKFLNVSLLIDKRNTPIKRGENNGRTLSNANIVVEEFAISLNNSTGTSSIDIPGLVVNSDKLSIVGLVQKKNFEISGAVQIEI